MKHKSEVHMKKSSVMGSVPGPVMVSAIVLAMCAQVSIGRAGTNTLTPGGVLYPVNPGPGVSAGATLLASNSVAWASSPTSINGTLVSEVWSGDANNAYHGLTFTYQVFLNASSINGLGQF